MRTALSIDDCAYTLYQAFDGTNAADVIKASRQYNEGMDFFEGSDCATVTVFLVAKRNVSLFIQELQSFIGALIAANVETEQAEELLDLTEYFNFAVLHKNIENAPFDFFVTNFMFDWSPFAHAVLEALSQSTESKLQALSAFSISAGSAYGDASVRTYAQAYLASKGLIEDEYEVGADMQDNGTYEELVPVFNEPAETILPAFIRLYFQNIPRPSRDEDSIDASFRKAIACL